MPKHLRKCSKCFLIDDKISRIKKKKKMRR